MSDVAPASRTERPRRPGVQRYQLSKKAVAVVATGHPWLFRGLMSSAAAGLADGQWLALYDGGNQVVGHGVYAAEGAVAVRLVGQGPTRPRGPAWLARIDAAVARRGSLRAETDGFRAIAGESDHMPGVVVDVFGTTVVAQAYATGLDALARLAARRVAAAVGATGVVVRAGHRRFGARGAGPRIIAGAAPDLAWFREGPLRLAARPLSGQKSGTFLDLRGLRRWLRQAPLAGARVLNLFAYTGALGLACEHAGASVITQIDRAADALAFAAGHHVVDAARHRFITADVFDWCRQAPGDQRFEVVIVDPPSMTSRIEQVPAALATYRRLHGAAAARVAPGGLLILACCTSRITRAQFRATALATVGRGFALTADVPPEVDHPVAFPEADYLKVLVFRARGAGA
ncbi:MAG: class I SAM-dependent methyltransferase [Kofleriaceae bacterium]